MFVCVHNMNGEYLVSSVSTKQSGFHNQNKQLLNGCKILELKNCENLTKDIFM